MRGSKYLFKQIYIHTVTCFVDFVTDFEHADLLQALTEDFENLSIKKDNFFTDYSILRFGTHIFPRQDKNR